MIAASLVERGLNRLLRATPGASDALLRHSGMSVRFDLLGMSALDYRIADDGCFSEAAVETPDAIVRPTAAMLARLPFFGRGALRDASYQGDPALLATLDRVFKSLELDLAAELAPLVGDIAAQRAARAVAQGRAGLRQAGLALGVNAAEYLVEEAEQMARRVDVDRFNRGVDAFADALARIEARLKRLDA